MRVVRVQAQPIQAIVASPLPIQPAAPHVNVLDYGARAVSGFDNAPAFQTAHDALTQRLATTPGSRGSLYVPESIQPYDFASPLYRDADRIDFESLGGGPTNTTVCCCNFADQWCPSLTKGRSTKR
jgi:hypothetical protein